MYSFQILYFVLIVKEIYLNNFQNIFEDFLFLNLRSTTVFISHLIAFEKMKCFYFCLCFSSFCSNTKRFPKELELSS